jgi:hypothetical protein
MSAKPDQHMLGQRFRLVRKLGEGGFATVFEALDLERNIRVAVKRLASASSTSSTRLVSLKREFRALSEVRHPNLVRLYELFEIGDETFFTMELIDGGDFCAWVRGEESRPDVATPTVNALRATAAGAREARAPWSGDEKRLRAAFTQLVAGVLALHDEQIVHRDLKPSNVLVGKDGRVYILDFGLIAHRESEDDADSLAGSLMGTPYFMAPEQALTDSVSEAADWYAVGGILYDALTGHAPFEGKAADVLLRKQNLDPADLRELVPGVAEDLADLCMRLLSRVPAQRPTDAQMRALLAPESRQRASRLETQDTLPPTMFVGRDDELAFLDAAATVAQTGRAQCVLVHGAPGVGKTALVEHFVEMLLLQGHHVFKARCRSQEHVSFMVLDELARGFIKTAARMREKLAQVDPADAADLVAVFPLFARLRLVPRERATSDPSRARAGATRALRALFAELSRDKMVALWIDDAQWIDADSASVLLDVLSPKTSPPLLVMISFVDGPEGDTPLARFAAALRHTDRARMRQELVVAPLEEGAAAALASVHLGPLSEKDRASSARIASEAEGVPSFVELLARGARQGVAWGDEAPAPSLDRAIVEEVRALPLRSRRLLGVLAVADGSLPYGVVLRASGLEGNEAFALLEELRTRRLIVSHRRDGKDQVELAHPRLGETVARQLDDAEAKMHLAAIARAVVDEPSADPGTAARHLLAAGDAKRAAELAVRGAEQAEAARAYARAAELYRLAIEAEPSQRAALQPQLGVALANAGRGVEAAEALLAAAESATSVRAIELRRSGAEQLARSGNVAAALVRFDEALRAVSLRVASSPFLASVSLAIKRLVIRFRGYRFQARKEEDVLPRDLARVDVAFSAAVGVTIFDLLLGAELQARHMLLALDVGEPLRVARALAFDAALLAVGGPRGGERVAQVLATAQAIVAKHEEARTPAAPASETRSIERPRVAAVQVRAFIVLCSGIAAYLEGRWEDAATRFDRAERALLDDCPSAWWELATARVHALHSNVAMGMMRRASKQVAALLRDVDKQGDRYLETRLRAEIAPAVWLAAGDVERVASEIAGALATLSTKSFSLQHFWGAYWGVLAALRRRDPSAAVRIAENAREELRRSRFSRVQLVRVHAAYMGALATLGAARGSDARALALATREARRIEDERVEWARGFAACVRAAIAAREGEKATATSLLQDASRAFTGAQMKLFAAIADRRRGELVGGGDGAALTKDADAALVAQGVSTPAEYAAMMLPAFE